MNDFLDSPLFGILISILAFEIGVRLNKKTGLALLNPLLIAIALVIFVLLFFHISLDSYNKGGDLISFFLGPATVILAVPLYKQMSVLLANVKPILWGVAIGCITAILSIALCSRLFGLDPVLTASLIPKSVTTPIGIQISQQIGGLPALTVAAIIITGITGAVLGPWICKVFKIRDQIAVGIAIGTSAHALGTTKALELGETEGAMSSLAIGLAGLFTAILAPLFMLFFS